ncbi:MAG: hypothetical protein R3C10_15215 [Pirellulales bacterium]
MKIAQRDTNSNTRYENNPRSNDAAVDAVAESIRQFGFRRPIVVDAASEGCRVLDGTKMHLANTDPPYNVKVELRSNNAIAAGNSSFAAPTTSRKAEHHQKFDLKRHSEKSKPTQKRLRAKDTRQLTGGIDLDKRLSFGKHAWPSILALVTLVSGAVANAFDSRLNSLDTSSQVDQQCTYERCA